MPKLTKSEYTPREVRQALADLLQEKIDSYGAQLLALRKREVGRTALAKGDLCLLCAQLPAKCPCLNLRKASAEEANREMKGFRSVASNPTFGGGSLTNAPKTAPRSGNGNRKASGVIPNAKAEGAPCKKTKIPRIRKSALAKRDPAAMPGADARPAASGIPGKQPVGQGGGDAFKVPHAATTASLNDVRQMAPNAANATKDKAALPKPVAAAPKPAAPAVAMPKTGMHPDTKASLGAVQAQAPKAAWSAQGLPGLKAKLQNVQASHALAPKPAAAPAPVAAKPLAPVAKPVQAYASPGRALGSAAVKPASNPAAELAADKRAGGVGFLNSLLSRFRSAPKAAAPVAAPASARATFGAAPVQSKRFHGALPLQRSEKPLAKNGVVFGADGKPAGFKKPDVAPSPGQNTNHIPKGRGADLTVEPKAKPKKSPFSLGKCAMCPKTEHKGICKEEMPAPTEGLASVNHSRTMLRVGSSKGRKRR